MNRPLENYVQHAPELAQDVINAWGSNARAGNAGSFTTDFKALLDKTFAYWDAKKIADNHRENNVLSEKVALEESTTREAFAIEYKRFHEAHEAAS